jgi:hypothetical protein
MAKVSGTGRDGASDGGGKGGSGGRGNGAAAAKSPRRRARGKAATAVAEPRFEHQQVDEAPAHAPAVSDDRLSEDQRVLLGDLFAVVEEHAADAAEEIDRELVQQAFAFACERHSEQRRASGEDFIVHPVGVAKICAGMRLDTATLCAALLHDTVEDTSPRWMRCGRPSGTRSRRWWTASRSSPASPSRAATTARPRTTER